MKKTINILLALAAIMTGLLTAYADSNSGQGYDPTNPPEPDVKYRVSTGAAPSNGGWTSPGNDFRVSGEQVTVCAYEHSDYTFACWMDGDREVSREREYTFTMPAHQVTLVAFYEYTPQSPAEPDSRFRVRVYVSPAEAGWVSEQSFLLAEGETREVYAYNNQNYTFTGWKLDGEIMQSGNVNPLNVTMPSPGKRLEYTAVFAYTPQSPTEPGTNSFDSATGRLVMDDFTPGSLSGRIRDYLEKKHLLDPDNIFSDKVNEVVVVGPVNWDDFRFLQNIGYQLPNLTTVDFSRVSAEDPAEFYLPWGTVENQESLVKILLPANLQRIESYAISNCPNLSEIVCFSVMPPVGDSGSITGVPESAVVRVPSESLELYGQTQPWNSFSLASLDNESCRIMVNLPREAEDGRYLNMTLVLENPESGRVQRLVINDRMQYLFSSLIPEMKYNLYMRDSNGENLYYRLDILTEKPDEAAGNTGLTVVDITDEEVLRLFDLTCTVTDADGVDISDSVEIKWNDSRNNYITSGRLVEKVIEGRSLVANVKLPQSLGLTYKVPAATVVEATEEGKDAVVALVPVEKASFSGIITGSDTGKPVRGAFVTVGQMVAGMYKYNFTARADADGKFTAEYIVGTDGSVTAGANGYVSQPGDLAQIKEGDNDFELKPISGVVIEAALQWQAAGADKAVPYADYANVEFGFYNLTQKRSIRNFSNQYPSLVLLDEVKAGDEIEATISSRNSGFSPVVANVTIDEKEEGFLNPTLVELGQVKGTFESCAADTPDNGPATVNALLYDATGRLAVSTQFDDRKSVHFKNLRPGDYTLVAIQDSRFFNIVNSYDDLIRSGLTAGTDFEEAKVTVADGKISEAAFTTVPKFDDSDFYYTSEVLLTVNKTSLTVGNYVTVRAQARFKPEYGIDNYALRIDLPEHLSFVENSVIKQNEPANGQMRDGSLWIDDVKDGDVVRFCLTPEKGQVFTPTAFAEFSSYNDAGLQSYSQPLGSVRFKGEDFTIFIPRKTCRQYVYARGVASSMSDVQLLTNGTPAGAARSTADGYWVARVDLIEPEAYPLQQVYGEITDRNGRKFPTQSTLVEYDEYYPELSVVKMYHNGQSVNFNHAEAKTDRKSYSYNPGNDMFSLLARFDENKERVSAVNFRILSTDGTERVIEGVYVESQDAWAAALGYPDSYRLPVNVTVDFTYSRPVPDPENPGQTIGGFSDFNVGYIAPDVTPIIDPSGFVYEAIETNRLEGVKCTVFYREGVENIYGDIEWQTVKWDAEEYAQENPLFTDANGVYAWDVPQGEWQVKFEKEGYETAYSAWLPVPPPQLEVNVGLVQNSRPEVVDVHAYAEGIDINFDKPMQTSSISADNLYVTVGGVRLEGSVKAIDPKDGNELPFGESVTARLRFVPVETLAATTGEIHLFIGNTVRSYAGINMLDNYDALLTIEKEITSITADNTSEISTSESIPVTVSVLPIDAAAGRILTVSNDSPDLLGITDEADEYTLDENGQAVINLEGLIPGVAKLSFNVKGSDMRGEHTISIINRPIEIRLPNATYADGTDIYRGTSVELTCQTPTAVIYYTTDGTDPTVDDKNMYTGPFTIDGGVTVKAIAVANGKQSEVATFTYGLKMSKLELGLGDGWNWISHNLADGVAVASIPTDSVERLLSQDAELIRDPKLGLVGNIDRLEYSRSYKVLASGPAAISLDDVAVNPATPVRLGKGWNWIGYSSTQTMTPDEAFAEMGAEKDDYILGQEGFASFDGEKWIGELRTLNPGAGYMYRSASEKDLVYNVGIVSKAAARHAAVRSGEAAPWVVDRRKYPSVMPVIADVITPDGRIAAEGEYEVGAFCGTECRGVGVYCEGYLMMSVYGNAGDDITFHLLPAGSGEALVLSDGLTFTETPQGSLDSPMRLDASRTTGVRSVAGNGVSVSVRDNILTVSGDPERIELYDTDGHKVISVRDGRSSVSLAGLQPGVHMVAVMTSGLWSYHKVMVR